MSAAVIALSSTIILIAITPIAFAEVNATLVNGTSAYFREEGEVSCSASNAHLYSTIDVDGVVRQYNKVLQALNSVQLDSLTRSKGEGEGSLINATFTELHSKLRAARERITLVCLEVGCVEKFIVSPFVPKIWKEPKKVPLTDLLWQHGRNRQTRGLVDDAIAFASAGLSVYTLFEVKRLNRELVQDENRVGHLARELKRESQQIRENADQVDAIRDQVRLMVDFSTKSRFRINRAEAVQYIELFASNLETYSEGLEQMIVQKRASLGVFDLTHITTALNKIKREAEQKELRVMCNSPSEVLQQEVSWLAQEGLLAVFIHLPLIESSAKVLYEYLPTPLQLSNSHLGRPKVEGDFLAVSRDNDKLVIMDRATLAACTRKDGLYLCKTAVELKDPKQSCLGSMFVGNSDFMAHYCEFENWNVKSELIIQIGNWEILSYVVPDHHISATVSCRLPYENKMSPAAPLLLHDMQEVSLDPDCVLTSNRFRIRTAPRHEISYTYVSRPLNEFLDNFRSSSLDPEELRNVLPSKFNRISPEPVDIPVQNSTENNWEWVLGLVILFLLIIAATLGYLCRNWILRCLLRLVPAPRPEPGVLPERDERQRGHGTPDRVNEPHHVHGAHRERNRTSRPCSIHVREGATGSQDGGAPEDDDDSSQVDSEPDDLTSILVAVGSGKCRQSNATPPLFSGRSSSTSNGRGRTRSRASSSGSSWAGSNPRLDNSAPGRGSDVNVGERSGQDDVGQEPQRDERDETPLHLDIPPLLPTKLGVAPADAPLSGRGRETNA